MDSWFLVCGLVGIWFFFKFLECCGEVNVVVFVVVCLLCWVRMLFKLVVVKDVVDLISGDLFLEYEFWIEICNVVVLMLFYGCGFCIFEVFFLIGNMVLDCFIKILCVFGKGWKECIVFVFLVVGEVVEVYLKFCFYLVFLDGLLFFGVCGGLFNLCMI